MKTLTLTAAFVAWGAAASAAQYTSAWFFGDSLSDPGNLFAITDEAIPPDPPYFQGRSSNGPVWAESVADEFTARGLETQNFAFAFANALPNDDIARGRPLQIPDLPDQIAAFDAASPGRLGARPVAALWLGANDIFGEIDTAAAPDTAGVAEDAANAVAQGVRDIAGLGVQDFVLFNLPPLEETPRYNLFEPQNAGFAEAGSDTFNTTLDAVIGELNSEDVNVTRVDMFAAFSDLIADPDAFGVTDAVNPCIIPGVSVCTPDQALERGFYDPVHPNLAVHAAIADLAAARIAPVPLPAPLALLAAGVAVMGGLRLQSRVRRKRARATTA